MQVLPVFKVKDRLNELDDRGCTHTRQVNISRKASAGTAGRLTEISKVPAAPVVARTESRQPQTTLRTASRSFEFCHAAFMGEFPPVVVSWFARRQIAAE
jgi:hypothetical protein